MTRRRGCRADGQAGRGEGRGGAGAADAPPLKSQGPRLVLLSSPSLTGLCPVHTVGTYCWLWEGDRGGQSAPQGERGPFSHWHPGAPCTPAFGAHLWLACVGWGCSGEPACRWASWGSLSGGGGSQGLPLRQTWDSKVAVGRVPCHLKGLRLVRWHPLGH